jgi:serine/threonine protein kinase
MDPSTAHSSDVPVLAFEDGLGRRYRLQTAGDRDLEVLCFRSELTSIPSFEFALRERVSRLSSFQNPSYARVRRVDRLNDGRGTLALFSECTPGVRLGELFDQASRRNLAIDTSTALAIVRQVVPAVAAFHQATHVAHGALGPERVVITPQARVVILEFVVGAALEQLHYSRERYWRDLRVALPPSAGLPQFDEHVDVAQIGLVALSLLLGRLVTADEYPGSVEDLVSAACEQCDLELLKPGLRSWLRRALQLDVRNAFRSATDAQSVLEDLLAADENPNALATFLSRFGESSKLGNVSAIDSVLSTADARIPVRPLVEHSIPEPRFAPELNAKTAPSQHHAAAVPATSTPPRREWPDFDDTPAVRATPSTPQAEDWRPKPKTATARGLSKKWVVIGVAVVGVGSLLFAGQRYFAGSKASSATGTLSVDTNPPGAVVVVDGTQRGQAPVSLSLTPGTHSLVVRGDGEPRTIPVNIVAGATSSQYLDLPKAVATTGVLQISTDPSGARVIVDGQARGITPLILSDLPLGEHSVTLENDLGSVSHKVTIAPGVPAALMVPLAAPQGTVVSGWLAVQVPVEMQLYEQGRLLGTTGIDRLMLPTGKHDIDIVNEVLGFRVTRSVQIVSGRVSNLSVTLPKGLVSLNAIPWANVSIDGENVGETPIGNLSIGIGPHEVAFRNPQLGEQRRVINVTLSAPVRLSVDLTKK